MSLDMGTGASGEEAIGGAQPSNVIYEIDAGELSDSGAQAADSAGSPAAPAPSVAATDPRDARIQALERSQAETYAQLQPWLAHLQAQRRQEASRPPIDPNRIDDPNAGYKPSDLVSLLRWEQDQRASQILAQSEARAAAVHSEQRARGIFNAEALGAGNDYDSMVNQYVAPLVSQNPAIDQLLSLAAPGDPAAGRMIFATIIHAIDRAGGDVLKGVKSVLAGLNAYTEGARQTARAQGKAATVAAARVFSGAQSGGPHERRTLKTAEDVWNMPQADFDRWYASQSR